MSPKFAPGELVEEFDPDEEVWRPGVVKDAYERGYFPFDPRPGGYVGKEPADGQFYTVDVEGYGPGDCGERDLRPRS